MTSPSPNMLRLGYLNALGAIALLTSFVIFSRMSGKSALTPYDIIALRYLIAGMVTLGLWMHYRTALFDRRKLVLSLIGALGFTLFAFNGFHYAPANHAAILIQGILPFSVAVMAYFLAHERPDHQKRIGLGLIALGIASMAHESLRVSAETQIGDALFIGASLCWGLYTVLLRRWRIPPMEATISVTVIASLLYLPVYAVALPKNVSAVSWQECLAYGLFQGVLVAVIQMIFYTRAVHYLGASRLSMFASVVPVLAALLAVPILDEPLTLAICFGLLFCCAGAWVGNRRFSKPRDHTL